VGVPDTPEYLRRDRARGDVGDFQSWVRPPWLARGTPGTVTIPQYLFDKTRQHDESSGHVLRRGQLLLPQQGQIDGQRPTASKNYQ